ncbi:tubulin-specific chaperone B [[Candida] anglica]|uniref:Tubulin-specific chaperone B n=1 Tax=[Candida] anglica TaxID=148631 RepID=A0ABP0ECI0_9ASCO
MSDINVYVTSEFTSSERRISPQWTIEFLRTKLELITGIAPDKQIIHYYPNSKSNEYIEIWDNDHNLPEEKSRELGLFNIVPYSRIHILDEDSDSIMSKVNKSAAGEDWREFKLSEEDYAKRQDSALKWKENNKLGRFDPQFQSIKDRNIEENLKLSSNISVGDRCRTINIQGERRGAVKFIGKVPELDQGEQTWVGIEFDEPVGKNNGTIDGIRIFECRENHGSFVKPKQCEVGDFPELDPFASDDDEL